MTVRGGNSYAFSCSDSIAMVAVNSHTLKGLFFSDCIDLSSIEGFFSDLLKAAST